jgi:hypothetical protein
MADHPVSAQPVELTDEEIQARAQQMYALDQAVRAGLTKGREGLWDAAKALYEFDEQSGWSALGDAEVLGLRDLRDLYWGPQKSNGHSPDEEEGGVTADPDDDETGLVYGLDDEPLEVEAEDVPTAPEETAPQFIYGEVLLQQVREALLAVQQGMESPSDLLRRVALQKAANALQAVLDAG